VRYLPSTSSWLTLTLVTIFFSCSLYRVDDVYDRPPVLQTIKGKLEFGNFGVLRRVTIDYRLLWLYGQTAFLVCELYLYLTGTIPH